MRYGNKRRFIKGYSFKPVRWCATATDEWKICEMGIPIGHRKATSENILFALDCEREFLLRFGVAASWKPPAWHAIKTFPWNRPRMFPPLLWVFSQLLYIGDVWKKAPTQYFSYYCPNFFYAFGNLRIRPRRDYLEYIILVLIFMTVLRNLGALSPEVLIGCQFSMSPW